MERRDVTTFDELQPAFERHVRRIVWAQVATVDRAGRPRMRLLHPIWEGNVAYVVTGTASHKTRHLARVPWVSVGYWDQQQSMVYAECHASWLDDPAERDRAWEYMKVQPGPYGYDPDTFFAGGRTNPDYRTLKLTAHRAEVITAGDSGWEEQLIWRGTPPA